MYISFLYKKKKKNNGEVKVEYNGTLVTLYICIFNSFFYFLN